MFPYSSISARSCPTVAPEDRFSVSRCNPGPGKEEGSLRDFYRVTIRHGYTDNVITSDLGLLIYDNLRSFIIREGSTVSHRIDPLSLVSNEGNATPVSDAANSTDTSSSFQQDHVRIQLDTLQRAYEEQVVYLVGKEQMRIDEVHDCGGWVRRVALAAFLWLRSNTGSKVANMNLDTEKLVEVGFVKVI